MSEFKTNKGNKISVSFRQGTSVKRPFVFIHGNAQNDTSGKGLMEFFYKKGHSILSYDLPGHGDSEPYPDTYSDTKATMNTFAETLNEVLSHFKIDKPIIAGHSMGGMILLEFGVKYPEKVGALILIDTSDISPVDANKQIPLKDIINNIIENCGKAFERRFKYDYCTSTEINEENILSIGFKCTDPTSLQLNFKATFNYDVTKKLSLLKMPVLILRGKDDPLMTKEMTEDMHKRIPHSKFVEVEGGHNWFLFNKELMRKTIEKYYYLFE
ncbi:alpha/beta hydrolase [Candidatus Woesearchaeota archaeon]|nr:alpha/beta hydrolase [Candidatus Woesearchaeota archaeon]